MDNLDCVGKHILSKGLTDTLAPVLREISNMNANADELLLHWAFAAQTTEMPAYAFQTHVAHQAEYDSADARIGK